MKVAVAEDVYTGTGFADVSQVGFDPAHASRIFAYLSKSLYSQPHLSMFREIAANALDAHRDAGEARPFSVSLPCALAPSLIVRDYGKGMAHDFVMRRAFSLGDSTKRGDNAQVGGFGLGCKTPFAVTDQFTLKVYRGDTSQTYLIDLHGGLPRVLTGPEMIETLATPETGTEWSIPVASQHWASYRMIADKILSHFPPGSYECDTPVSVIEYTLETPDFAVRKDGPASYALVGPVAYAINTDAVTDDGKLPLPARGIELRMTVGEVTLHPSREQLEYDDKTKAAIAARVATITAYARDLLTQSIAAEPSLIGAQWASIVARQTLGTLRDAMPDQVDWQGRPVLAIKIAETLPPKLDDTGAAILDDDGKPLTHKREYPVIFPVASWSSNAARFKRIPKRDKEPVASFEYASLTDKALGQVGLHFIVDDCAGDKLKARVATIANAVNALPSGYGRQANLIVISQAMADEYGLAAPGSAKVTLHSLKAAAPWKPLSERNKAAGKVRAYSVSGWHIAARGHGKDLEPDHGGVYCSHVDGRVPDHGAIKLLQGVNALPSTVYAIPKSAQSRLNAAMKAHPGEWQHWRDAAVAALTGLAADKVLTARLALMNSRAAYDAAISRTDAALIAFAKAHPGKSLVLDLIADAAAPFDFTLLERTRKGSPTPLNARAVEVWEVFANYEVKALMTDRGIDIAACNAQTDGLKALTDALAGFRESYKLATALLTHCGSGELEDLAAEIIATL